MSLHTLFDRRAFFLAFLAYLAFVVYGSLVPFELLPYSFEQAQQKFAAIGYLNLGATSRADWIANIVLYVPLAFLGCGWVAGMRSLSPLRHLAALLVLAFCVAVTVAVEFAQIFFAPRTVSLNDLLAETLGSIGGVVLFGLARWRILRLLDAFLAGGRNSVVAAGIVYALLYAVLSLFPYDFVLSRQEFSDKLAAGGHGWLLACDGSGWLRCAAHQASEVAALVPLGVLIALAFPKLGYRRLFLTGAALGLVLELVQLLLVSGVSQGLSLVWRGAGLVAGAAIGDVLRRSGSAPVTRLIRLAIPFVALPYGLLLAGLGGWFSGEWISPDAALARLPDIHFMPFYYHYFTTESAAMASLFAQAGMYAPVGLAVWALRRNRRAGGGAATLSAAAWAAVLAAPIEFGKLFVPPKHPDATNLLIVAVAAAVACAMANWMERVLSMDGQAPRPHHPNPRPKPNDLPDLPDWAFDTQSASYGEALAAMADAPARMVPPPTIIERSMAAPGTATPPGLGGESASFARRHLSQQSHRAAVSSAPAAAPTIPALSLALAGAALLATLAGLAAYPVGAVWLGLALLGYGVLLWYRPSLLFFLIPALLPALDFGPVTGRPWLDEFDLAVLVALAVGYARLGRLPVQAWPHRGWPVAVGLLWTTWALATTRGLWPLLDGGGEFIASSHSPWEAWRVGKGLLWALLLVPLLRRIPAETAGAVLGRIHNGVIAGLVAVVAVVLWERSVFVGLGDFENVFRATGPFADMGTGGAYIEAFLAFAFPLLAAAVVLARSLAVKGLGIALAASATYAMLVTFSRGGYAGLVAGLLPVALCLFRAGGGGAAGRRLALAGVVLAAVAAAVPVLSGSFAQARLAQAGADFAIRQAHWARALGLMDDGLLTALAGMGFGRYPALYLLRADIDRPPGTYAVLSESGNPYVRLGAGEAVYLDQIVPVEPGGHYTLSARVRPSEGDAALGVALCEKALLYSFECDWQELRPSEDAGDGWGTASVELDAGRLSGGWLARPVKLSLQNPGAGGSVDVDDVSLMDGEGRELLANGDFSRGAACWLFVADQDLAWHIHQMEVEVYVAQGWLGLGALAVLLACAVKALWPGLRGGDLRAAGHAGALVGLLTVGLLGSVMDSARLSMLFFMGAFCAGLLTLPDGNARPPRRIIG
jgi:glycopeptide antibiotics resistance protein